ncbi:CDP-alcohol phosphatidyltransferase family protein ['Fragaria x ananassa' phyllody phytoplasma]|uniref:CDP-alcohol phosphatidyltransferase family protein n=1 Tax='Fragaria x ananassa' phyllody phytoplasma TaxID=2358428 RepID=A0ABS5K2R4_9MOLU|nr:CDP-alcohol phosphatidyltransferase family protein ['Fragaria x ananassa' phyllody phytoplasma]MBS2126173.1 CDP-alcohol phosphatidyltransferase family protein ['Fragaria x ananassa' phyllody phytoplasma]
MFLGLYNYTTYLTYLNLISGFCGIGFAVHGKYSYALIFLLISGILDMFDGLVSRTKKNRTLLEKKYGVQIDSLADMISFGLLPVFINYTLLPQDNIPTIIWFFWSLYILAALVRLAYYNVLTEEHIASYSQVQKFIGIPVTTSAIVFPCLGLLQKIFKNVLSTDKSTFFWIHFVCLLLLTFLFLFKKIELKKFKNKKIMIIISVFLGSFWIISVL